MAAKGWFIAMVSTTVETDNPELEIKPGLDLLGPIHQKFVSVSILSVLLHLLRLGRKEIDDPRVPTKSIREIIYFLWTIAKDIKQSMRGMHLMHVLHRNVASAIVIYLLLGSPFSTIVCLSLYFTFLYYLLYH